MYRKLLILISIIILCETALLPRTKNFIPVKKTQPNAELMGWQLDKTNTGIARAGLTEKQLKPLDFSSGPDKGKGVTNYQGVNGNIYINANQTIENKIISPSYQLHITAGNVTLRNCIIRPTNVGRGLPLIVGENATVENCNIDATQLGIVGIAISMTGTIRGCNIWGSSTGISINNSSSKLSICEGNYIHDLEGHEGAHMDGITTRMSSGKGVTIRNNRVDVTWKTPSMVTGAMFIQSQAGPIDNLTIENNLFEGHGYNLSMGISSYKFGSNVSIINNRFNPAKGGWGAVAIQNGIKIAVDRENHYYDKTKKTNSVKEAYKGNLISVKNK